ncbi:hypothetical protein DYB28_000145 [Aphanomyces astaci]|uniref:Uncharacterized protein n=1 Tax=Aphanomyces astaci TaxID=112090 RepID=A0A397EPF4_APHAT|nr:hypothetical protein DYB36_000031 [Aphanomyces astaci]RHY90903.1 hypothetical protein DYB31_000550 [Aphanomyces astaci]RLO00814.1 hypothetical protein DYB28_000145 [Aphanomyces astaci]
MFIGDSAGYIRTWGLSVTLKDKGMYFEHGCQWRIGGGRILSLNFIENTRQIDMFVLVSSGNGEVSLWTLDSVQVGVFGRHKYWHLGKPATYSASTPQANAHAGKHHKHFIPSRSIAAALSHTQHMESQLTEDTMPKPGEVWICRSTHHHNHRNSVDLLSQVAAAATVGKIVTTSFLGGTGDEANLLTRKASMSMARDATSDIADVITVIKVSKGEILAWDGFAQQIKQKTLKLDEFVRDNMWARDSHFSQCIGRCFMSTHENTPYKCLYVAIKSVHMNIAEGEAEGGHDGMLPPATNKTTAASSVNKEGTGLVKPDFVCSTLPLLRPKDKHVMGGNPPKRSNMRSKLDPNADFRRVHDPQTIPKTTKEVLEQRHRHRPFDAVGLQ